MAAGPVQPKQRHAAIAAAIPAGHLMIALAHSGLAIASLGKNEDRFI
jgi:hypothetical protein